MVIGIFLTAASFIATMISAINQSVGFVMTASLFTVSIVLVYYYTKTEDSYTGHFKRKVIQEIIAYLHPGLVYKPEGHVSSKEYKRSSLYRRRYQYYEGDDLLQGRYKEVDFYCSEIHTQYQGGRRGRLITIFKGLFFVAGVNPQLAAGTYVWSKDEDQFARSVGDELYRLLPMPQVVEMKMHDAAFEQYFCACSTDPAEARRILTPEMRTLLVKYRKQLRRKVVFSVVAGRCYVAVPISEDLLEPSADPTDKEQVKTHFFTILLVFSIINQLQLARLV